MQLPNIPAVNAPTDLTDARIALVIGTQLVHAPAKPLGLLGNIGTAVAGDMIYASAAGTWARLAKGTALQHLRMNSGATAPEWSSYATIESLEGLTLAAGDILYATGADTLAKLAKGAALQILRQNSALTAPEWATVREFLTSNRTYYVRTDGSDSNTGLVDSAGGAFLTIQKAVNVVAGLDLSTNSVTIQVRSGTYTGAVNITGGWAGNGTVTLTGDTTTPSNVVISTTSSAAITVGNGASVRLEGFRLQTTTSGRGLSISEGARVIITGNMSFHTCVNEHIVIGNNGYLQIASNYGISGGATAHIAILLGGTAEWYSRTVTITNSPTVTIFIFGSSGGVINTAGATYSGAITAKRYDVSANAVVNTNGGGATYFPGGTAGTTATGGQYL